MVPLEYRVGSASATRAAFNFSHAVGAPLFALAANVAIPGEYGPATVAFPNSYDQFLTGDDTQSVPSSSRSDTGNGSSSAQVGFKTPEPPQPDTRIHWYAANKEALLSTGIMHVFNLWTEAGTRDALYGPWFQNWMHSVSELRGWSDSDQFMAPYAGHPIQGSIFRLHPAT